MRMTCEPPLLSRRNVSTKIAKSARQPTCAVAAAKTWRSPPCPPPSRPRTASVAPCTQAIWTTIAPSVSFLGAPLKRILKLGRLRLRGPRGAEDEFVHRYQTIRGHVFCSFLALVLKKALEDRIAALGHAGSRPEIIADLDALTETEIEHDGKRFLLRSAPRPAASLALRAAGVALPPTVRKAAID